MTITAAIVQVLLSAGLVDDDTPDTWALAGRLLAAYSDEMIGNPQSTARSGVQAVAEQIDREQLGLARSDVVQQAAAQIVAMLRGEGQ